MALGIQVTFDCADPARLATFWADALGYRKQEPPEGYGSWEEVLARAGWPEDEWGNWSAIIDPEGKGPRIYFQRVPEGKIVKNRVHLDLNAGGPSGTPAAERRPRVEAEVRRLEALGASQQAAYEQYGEFWVVMQDPEQNEFCVQ